MVAILQKRRIVGAIAIALVLITIFSIVGYLVSNQPSKFVRAINRNFSSPEEKTALMAAENANYSKIFNVTRFGEGKYQDTTIHPNFINSDVIQYYNKAFGTPKILLSKSFYYSANASQTESFKTTFDNSTNSVGLVNILGSNGSVLSSLSARGLYAYDNGSGIQRIESDIINFDFHNCYLVTMELMYSEMYGNVGGFMLSLQQAVILDRNYEVLLVGNWFSIGQA